MIKHDLHINYFFFSWIMLDPRKGLGFYFLVALFSCSRFVGNALSS